MKNAMLLDCTLRDGAYLVDKIFGDTVIRGMITGMAQANIDIIEIGFLQTEGFGEGKTVFKNGEDAKRFVPTNKGHTLYTVLADCSRYDVKLLDDNKGDTFDAVRVCFFKHEREDAVEFCRQVQQRGYKFFVQPVDILGYADHEMLDLIEKMNALSPYCFSIVDTFGSMYVDDLERAFHLINHNLSYESKIGFHSHNNMQMSSALSQAFLRMSHGLREVVVDTTISGMGRGAGNAPTELLAQYMVQKLGYNYDLDVILDLIDTYMPGILAKCSWGYSTPYFIAGCYSAHVNNISYLSEKNGIVSKDIRYILNKIGEKERKRYNYSLLEDTYAAYLSADIDDKKDFEQLKNMFSHKKVIAVAPGQSSLLATEEVARLKKEDKAVVVAINHIPNHIDADYLFVSNSARYNYWKNDKAFLCKSKIFTSNLDFAKSEVDFLISYKRVLKCGWENMDNSMILLLRLLDQLQVETIGIAGFDGYDTGAFTNYSQKDMEREMTSEQAIKINRELTEMLRDFMNTKEYCHDVHFLTPSRFAVAIEEM